MNYNDITTDDTFPLFSQPLYKSKVDVNLKPILKHDWENEKIFTVDDKSNKMFYNEDDRILDRPLLKDLKEQVELNIECYLKRHLCLDDEISFYQQASWIMINKPGAVHPTHVHNNAFLSGVVYIKVPENSGNIVFSAPDMLPTWSSPVLRPGRKSFNLINSDYFVQVPQPKTIYIFPGHMQHRVEENKSDEDRISISFNYYLKGKIFDGHGHRLTIS